MASLIKIPVKLLGAAYESAKEVPLPLLLLGVVTTLVATVAFVCSFSLLRNTKANIGQIYALLFIIAPIPRPALPSEKTYITTTPDGKRTSPKPLPCWHDEWLAHRKANEKAGDFTDKHTGTIDEAEIEMSVVIPAYNEEERINIMLEEAVAFLDTEYGRTPGKSKGNTNGNVGNKKGSKTGGYEILIVNDGSKDKTVDVALAFSRKYGLHDILRICTLKENRGKGGAVTHGFRHVRGSYTVFADADGASKFEDLAKLVEGCDEVADEHNRGIAVGSRAHMVGSEAVIKVCLAKFYHLDQSQPSHSDPQSATPSCTPSTYSSVSSPHPPHRESATPNVASNSSRGPRCRISYLTCTPKAGSSMWRC
jgi:dolichyl-phosphate beta-glucosyltransferase